MNLFELSARHAIYAENYWMEASVSQLVKDTLFTEVIAFDDAGLVGPEITIRTALAFDIHPWRPADIKAETGPVAEMLKAVEEGDAHYKSQQYVLARLCYQAALDRVSDYLKSTRRPVNDDAALVRYLGLLAYQKLWIPASVGDCYLNMGSSYREALAIYEKIAENYPELVASPTMPWLWVQIARAYLAWGDTLYRRGNANEALEKYRIIITLDGANRQSKVYKGSFTEMLTRVDYFFERLPEGPTPSDIQQFPDFSRLSEVLFNLYQRQKQIDQGLDYLGLDREYVPSLRFEYLQNVARAFAQFAAQANREYMTFRRKAEDDRFTMTQLEQARNLNREAIGLEQARLRASMAETAAARSSAEQAQGRVQIAKDSLKQYESLGWDIVRLETAQAWASSAVEPYDRQIQQSYSGLEDIGIKSGYVPRSNLIHEIAFRRNQRSYELERSHLRQSVTDMQLAQAAAQSQAKSAAIREEVARLSVKAAQWRWRDSIQAVEQFSEIEINGKLFNDFANSARDTARLYLERAILAAAMMQKAYEFESGERVGRVRYDYGDVDVAQGLYAADMLLRDIDYFTYRRIETAQSKVQAVTAVISLASRYPLAFSDLRSTGHMQFSTTIEDLRLDYPGIYNARVASVDVLAEGLVGSTGPIGSLSYTGVSGFRRYNPLSGEKIVEWRTLPPETLLLGEFRIRRDMGSAVPQSQLRVFENIGLETTWSLSYPRDRNRFNYTSLTDVRLVIQFLCEYNAELAEQDKHDLPNPEVITWFSLASDFGPDAMFQLKTHGELDFTIRSVQIPANHDDPRINGISIIVLDEHLSPLDIALQLWPEDTPDESVHAPEGHVVRIVDPDPAKPHSFKGKTPVASWHLRLVLDSSEEKYLRRLRDVQLVLNYIYTRPA